jgi:hypothetical protein
VVVLVEGQQLLEAGVLGQHDLLLAFKYHRSHHTTYSNEV